MIVEQIYTNCLAEAAYYIESNGEAAIIDPLRDPQPYIEKARERGTTIKYIFETHFHADFVSGHIDLAKETGATIVFGPGAKTDYAIHEAQDGETFSLGSLQITLLHTPGHTLESSVYLLEETPGNPHAVFTGDTLFIGDVGRPDLAVKSDLTTEDLAGMLYDSLRNKIMTLPDEVLVYPAHGAGSACGKNISREKSSTIGEQKQSNYALQDISKADFVAQVTDDIQAPPLYFAKNAQLNKQGYESYQEVKKRGLQPLSLEDFKAAVNRTDTLVLDTRNPQDFCQGFLPGSWNIGLGGAFAVWVGSLIEDLQQPILLVCDPGKEEESVMRLSRVGYDNVVGYLEGGISPWLQAGLPLDHITSIPASELATKIKEQQPHVVDVRKPGEYNNGHIEGSQHVSLSELLQSWQSIDDAPTHYIHCQGGYRSMIAASILKSKGMDNVIDVQGGFNAIKQTDIPMVVPEAS